MRQVKSLIKFTLTFLIVTTLLSCTKRDTYYDLSEEAKDLLLYEVGDSFNLFDINTNEIITLTINYKTIYYYEDQNPGNWMTGSGSDDYYERGQYSFSDATNCYNGTIAVEATSNNNFELTAYIGECFGNPNFSFEYHGESLESVEVNGITYTNVYLIKSNPQTIFYTKEYGIIKIIDNLNQETRFTIAE